MNRALIIAEAREWVGTPWQHQASLKGVGADCIGLVAGVARNLDISGATDFFADADVRGYGRQPDPVMLEAACRRYLEPITVPAAKMADVLVLRFERDPMHFALLSQTDPACIIHAYARVRKVTEHRMDAAWRLRIVSAWRFRGMRG